MNAIPVSPAAGTHAQAHIIAPIEQKLLHLQQCGLKYS